MVCHQGQVIDWKIKDIYVANLIKNVLQYYMQLLMGIPVAILRYVIRSMNCKSSNKQMINFTVKQAFQ